MCNGSCHDNCHWRECPAQEHGAEDDTAMDGWDDPGSEKESEE